MPQVADHLRRPMRLAGDLGERARQPFRIGDPAAHPPGGRFGEAKDDQFALTIDPAITPKVVDILAISGNNKGDQFEGIYKLDGDKLEMCIRTPAGVKDRPTEFASPANTGLVLIKMKRVK